VNDHPQKATAELEIRVGCRVPEGTLVTGECLRREFFGWTELAAAIEEWRHQAEAIRVEGGEEER
jgi:hypothetical protein